MQLGFPLCILVGIAVLAGPPSVTANSLPPMPESQVLDTSRFFDEEREEELSQALRTLGEEHGVLVYAVSMTAIIGDSPDGYAEKLYRSWIEPTGKNGVVILYARGDHKLSFGTAEKLEGFLPRYELERIFRAASEAARAESNVADRLEAAVQKVARELNLHFSRIASEEGSGSFEQLKLYVFVIGGAVIVTLVFFIFARILRTSEVRESRFYHFPTVEIGERLGAPHGGGVTAELRFTRRP